MTHEQAPPSDTFVAHIRRGSDGSIVEHDLGQHLVEVAGRAQAFASEFKAGDWARLVSNAVKLKRLCE